MNIKKYGSVLSILALGFSLGFASAHIFRPQPHRDHHRDFSHRLGRLSSMLKLDSEQKKEAKEIFHSSRNQLRSLKRKMRPEFEKIREESKTKLEGILEPEQLKRFREHEGKREKRRKRRSKRHRQMNR